MLPAGIKIASAEILQTTRCKCASAQCKTNKCSCVRAGFNCSGFCDCEQCNNQSDMHMDLNEIEYGNNENENGTEDQ